MTKRSTTSPRSLSSRARHVAVPARHRDLVTRVTEARRSVQDADDELDIVDPREQDHDDIENLRSELDELGERLGVRRG
jgi:hypothetical protein